MMIIPKKIYEFQTIQYKNTKAFFYKTRKK